MNWLLSILIAVLPYTKSLVQVPVAQGDTVNGYLLVPEGAKNSPAILAFHDHGARFTIGKEKICFPLDTAKQAEAVAWVQKFYEGQFVADTLASRGYVVLVIDALYWGERRLVTVNSEQLTTKELNKQLKAAQPEFYQTYLAQTGRPWFEKILADDKACVDYLLALPYVNKENIGVWGFSMGAYRAWQLAAEDKRLAWCAAANWMRSEPETGVSSWSMYRPSKEGIPFADIVAKIAPRPMLLQYGAQDKLFPYGEHVQPWETLIVEVIEGEHRFTREHMRNLLEWIRE